MRPEKHGKDMARLLNILEICAIDGYDQSATPGPREYFWYSYSVPAWIRLFPSLLTRSKFVWNGRNPTFRQVMNS